MNLTAEVFVAVYEKSRTVEDCRRRLAKMVGEPVTRQYVRARADSCRLRALRTTRRMRRKGDV